MLAPYEGPVASKTLLRQFLAAHAPALAEAQATKLWALDAEISPVPTLVDGMEVLLVQLLEQDPGPALKTALLETLHNVATAVGIGQYGGAATRDRAWDIAAWAAYSLDPAGTEPPTPEVASQFTTIAPEPLPLVPT